MSDTWHDYPKVGERTTCCNRLTEELPLGDGRTSQAAQVNCDGNYTPALWAHEVYPHPSECHDKPPRLEDAVRYHLARTVALYPAEFDGSREWMDRITQMLAERKIACLVLALHKGLSGQEALDWAHAYSSGDDAEIIYDLAHEYGVDLGRIRLYEPARSQQPDLSGGAE